MRAKAVGRCACALSVSSLLRLCVVSLSFLFPLAAAHSQYTRYGVEVSEMHDAIDSIEDVIRDYQTI